MPKPDRSDEQHDQAVARARRSQRAAILGLLLGALVVLIFAITIVKIRHGMGR